MEVVSPKREKTVSLPTGDVLVVAASTGALARVWRIDDVPVTSAVVQSGTVETLGPNDTVTRYNIESISGDVAYDIRSPEQPKEPTMTDAAQPAPAPVPEAAQPVPAAPVAGAVKAPAMKLPNFGAVASALAKLNSSLEKRAQRILNRAQITDAKGADVEARVVKHLEATEAAMTAQIAHLDQVDAMVGDNGAPDVPLSE
jgi:hypothetical protein